jgi:hypothetical protein
MALLSPPLTSPHLTSLERAPGVHGRGVRVPGAPHHLRQGGSGPGPGKADTREGL